MTLSYVCERVVSVAYARSQRHVTSGALGMREIWLHPERRFLGVVTISGVAKCTFGRRGYCRVDVHRDSLPCRECKWCAFRLSSRRATASACTLNVRRTLVVVFVDDTKQTAGRSQFRESRSALQ